MLTDVSNLLSFCEGAEALIVDLTERDTPRKKLPKPAPAVCQLLPLTPSDPARSRGGPAFGSGGPWVPPRPLGCHDVAMANIYRVRALWTGMPGAPGVSTFYTGAAPLAADL